MSTHRSRAVFLLLALFACLIWPARPTWALDLDAAVAAVPNPQAQSRSWVADPAGAIRLGRDEINALIQSNETNNGMEIAVVVLPSIGDFNPKTFATALFNHWGVGKKGRDNGVLVLHVLDQRRIEIETGYGLEGALPDVKCHWIVEDIAIPFFKQGSFSDGHFEIVRALIKGNAQPDSHRLALTGFLERSPGARVDPPPSPYTLPHSQASLGDFHTESPIAFLSLAALVGGLALGLAWAGMSRRYRQEHPDPGDQLIHFRKRAWLVAAGMALIVLAVMAWEWQSLTSLWSMLSAAPVGFLTHRYRRHQMTRLRDQPRLDPTTGEPMRRLNEADDDAYLAAGQICEEKLRSMDYDVWVSPSGFHRIERYDGKNSFETCEQCGFSTYRKVGTRVLDEPTTFTAGEAEDRFACAHCGFRKEVRRTLARLGSSSSGSSGSSSSGGGSFGGGSSGGGGAGGSY